MAAINAYRMDGLGNDFIIIDRRENFIEIKKNKIIELGNRANIGFDQIIFIEKQREDSYPITIYNSDGGEVSACGNGARCVAYLLSENLNTKKIQIKTNKTSASSSPKSANSSFSLNDCSPYFRDMILATSPTSSVN